MKKILLLIFLAILPVLVLGLSLKANNLDFLTYSVCDRVIRYRIDTVDPKFNLSEEDFKGSINEAAQIWNDSYIKPLFVYDPKGVLSINLIYDERQSLTTRIDALEDKVKVDKQTISPELNEYQRLAAEFKIKAASLNKDIDYWNDKGGAPPDEYDKITKKQQELQAESDNLNAMAGSLNLSTEKYNAEVKKLNQTINSFNSALEQRPEEGIFIGPENRIEIYFNISRDELTHTLAHELGHALGLGHVADPKALMFAKTTQTLTPSDDDKIALSNLCKRRSMVDLIYQRTLVIGKFLKLAPNLLDRQNP